MVKDDKFGLLNRNNNWLELYIH